MTFIGVWRSARAFVGLSLVAAGAVGCGSSGPEDAEPAVVVEPTAPAVPSPTPTIETLSEVVCSDTPTRDTDDYGMITDGTWFCTHEGEDARIDMFTGEDQLSQASSTLLSFYSSDVNRPLATVPIVCGRYWSVGVDTSETRDALIQAFNDAGIPASTCD